MKELKRCIIPLIFTIVVLVMFFNINKIKGNTNSDNAGLVIYGDNIKTNYEPFVKDICRHCQILGTKFVQYFFLHLYLPQM